eukprot:COSAG01_NODE_3393_length_6149_cov_24.742149_12_plen_98_part_00
MSYDQRGAASGPRAAAGAQPTGAGRGGGAGAARAPRENAMVDAVVSQIYEKIRSREEASWTFGRMDRDGSGTLDARELQTALRHTLKVSERARAVGS